ncbi:MAG TPA: ATP-binding protein [Polyangiaceae bacterium]|nr:ATP-binding protein [Polyangiaceae bacterium]
MTGFSEDLLLRQILALSSDALIGWNDGEPRGNADLRRKVVLWSSAAERWFGYSEAEALALDVKQLFASDPDELEPNRPAAIDGIGRTGGRIGLDITTRRLPASAGSCRSLALLQLRASGSPSGELLGADAERLNLALAAARLGDWIWDASSDLVTFSPRAAEIFGIPAGTHMTWTAMRELLHPEDRELARVAVERALASREDYSLEYRLINDERERWISASGRGRYDGSGKALGMFGVVQDITNDRLLVRLDDAVRPLVKSEDITYTSARLLGQHLNVDRCAYAFVEEDQDTFLLTGNYTRGVPSIVGRYRFRQFGAECLRLMRAGEPYIVRDSSNDPRIDAEDRKAYAATQIVAVICVPIVKSGKFVAAMAVHCRTPRRFRPSEVALVQQVASRSWESIERTRVERERESLLESAESANRAKDEFLAMLGHELRNPLAPIQTALQVMKLRDDADSARERALIERQVNHLTRLVDDLLDVSRIARAKVVLKFETLELADVVRQAIELVSPLIEQRAHQLVVAVAGSGLLIEGDAARLTQVVSSLLTNAAKYTPSGGQIRISGSLEEDYVVLRIRDNGMGIAPDVLPRIFDLFVQGQQAIDRALGGLGLGLTIVHSLVERHGGRVTASSDGPGRGSEFVVQLPRAKESSSRIRGPEARASFKPRSGVGLRVLVVDDNEDAAEMLGHALALRGYEVHLAHDGPHALRLAAAQAFDAALLDIGLPIMDGYELAARLLALPSLAHAKLIAVTGYGQDSDRRRALAAGFHHHLVKPVELGVLDALLTGSATPNRTP